MAFCVWNVEWNPSNFPALLDCVDCFKCSLDGGDSLRSEVEILFFWRWGTVYSRREHLARNSCLNRVPQIISWRQASLVRSQGKDWGHVCGRWSWQHWAWQSRKDFLSWPWGTASWWSPRRLLQTDVSSVSFLPPIVTCFPVQLLALCFTLLRDCQQHVGTEEGLWYRLLVVFSLKCPAQYSEFTEYPTHTHGIAFSSPWNDLSIYQCAPINPKTTSLIFKGYFAVSLLQKYWPTIAHSS